MQKLTAILSLSILSHTLTAAAAGGSMGKTTTSAMKVPADLKDRLANYVENHGPALLGAILILVAGIFVARWVGKLAMHWLSRKELQLEPPVRMLIVRLLRLLVFVFALVIAAGTAGVDVTALVASIGVAGLGVGLAMQGVLSNVVAGLTIIFTKPFRVGEYIELLGTHGLVSTIELFSTTLQHPDRSRVVIPNRKIVGEILHNYGTIRQLDLLVGVGYSTNISEALAAAREILSRNPRVLKDPAPGVGVKGLGDSSVNIAIKPWVAVSDYGAAVAELNQAILEEFRLRRIEIPFPQREIRFLNAEPIPADGAPTGAQSSSSARS
jgi:small conductance mechanosensitive channel